MFLSFKFDFQSRVRNIIYKGSKDKIMCAAMPDGKLPLVWISLFVFAKAHVVLFTKKINETFYVASNVSLYIQVSGPVFFSKAVAERLLQTHVTSPLDGCTYLGMDSGAPPLEVNRPNYSL